MHVSMMETYDLSTAVGKMGLIAIRTPNMSYINRKWPGFVRNFKYVRVNSATVQVACAQMLPADPLQVGFEPGQVAPQDMFNPILYRTVSNDSWNGLINRIYSNTSGVSLSGSVSGASNIDAFPSAATGLSTNAYYAFLSENGWRKAHPQQGLSMRGVRPIVWPLLHTLGMPLSGTVQSGAPNSDAPSVSAGGGAMITQLDAGSYLKGHAVPLPRVPTILTVSESAGTITPVLGYIPTCYCCVICTPPATQSLIYFRLVVVWDVEFIEPRSDAELGLIATANDVGRYVHYENMAPQPVPEDSSKGTLPGTDLTDVSETAVQVDSDRSVVADGVTLNLVMEK